MDRRKLSATKENNHCNRHSKTERKTRAPKGLQIIERDGYYHIHGSILVGKRTVRIRKSTGLLATVENWEAADSIRDRVKANARTEIIHGKKKEKLLTEAANLYLKQSSLKRQDRGTILEIVMGLCVDWTGIEDLKGQLIDKQKPIRERLPIFIEGARENDLEFRNLREIGEEEWQEFIDDRHKHNTPQTRQRYLNVVMPFIRWCFKMKWMDELPEIKRSSKGINKAIITRRRVSEITPELIQMMIDHSTWHLKPHLAVEWSTGARVSSVLCQVRRCDVMLDKGQEQITFGETKNGDPVVCALHPWAAEVIRQYKRQIDEKLLAKGKRMQPEDAFFRDWRGWPYKYNENKGGASNRKAFNTMKRRVIEKLQSQGRSDEADLMSQFTQHWFRHKLATDMNKNGADTRTVMEQGGWKSPAMVMHYTHDVPEKRRSHVASLQAPDTFLTRKEI